MLFHEISKLNPGKRSVVVGKKNREHYLYSHYTFGEQSFRVKQYGAYFKKQGIKKGDRVLVFVKPNLDFSTLIFSLFEIGAVVVLIDPGMGIKKLLGAIKDSKPSYLVAIPLVHLIKFFIGAPFKTIKKSFNSNNIKLSQEILNEESNVGQDDLAAILFTSGGTGKPKGVLYPHKVFLEQTKMLKEAYGLTPDDIDMPGFPLFGLFTLCMGMTSVIPDMNPSKPSKAGPEKLITMIRDQKITFAAGSPAIWGKVSSYALGNSIKLDSLKYVVMFGAPISYKIHEEFKKILPFGSTYTPYGATECLPVTNVTGDEVLLRKSDILGGRGVYVGKPVNGVEVVIYKNEVLVHSPSMTLGYFGDEVKSRDSKIVLEEKLYHRMGDAGYLDSEGGLYFLGRMAHIVSYKEKTYYPISVEAIFNQHKKVKRSALISLRTGEPGIVIERFDSKSIIEDDFLHELKELALSNKLTKEIQNFYAYPSFPVDVRHNIKIDRKKLGEWARSKHQ